jgi:hypothetical protein
VSAVGPGHVGGELLAFAGVLGHVILHGLALAQGPEALGEDGRLVHEDVVAALQRAVCGEQRAVSKER